MNFFDIIPKKYYQSNDILFKTTTSLLCTLYKCRYFIHFSYYCFNFGCIILYFNFIYLHAPLTVHILLYILNNSDQKFDMLPIWYHKFFSNSYYIYH